MGVRSERQKDVWKTKINDTGAKEWAGQNYSLYDSEDLEYIRKNLETLYYGTDKSILFTFGAAGFGDWAVVPGPFVKDPVGIRSVNDWITAHYEYPDYIKDIYKYQTETALKNLEKLKAVLENKIDVIQLSGTDFGTQSGPLMKTEMFNEFYKPFYKEVIDWVHGNTGWKTLNHTCGSIYKLLPEFIDMGLDILNPVQWTAAEMDLKRLKKEFGGKIVFWGGGVNTQKTLPFGTANEVKKEVKEVAGILSEKGGFVFAAIHNVMANTPVENIVAAFETISGFRN